MKSFLKKDNKQCEDNIINYSNYNPVIKKDTKKYFVLGNEKEIGEVVKELVERSKGEIFINGYLDPLISGKLLDKELLLNSCDGLIIGDPKMLKFLKPMMDSIIDNNISIEFLPLLTEKYIKKIPVEVVKLFEDYYAPFFYNNKNQKSIRLLDISLSLALMTLAIPPFLLAANYIILRDGFPIIFMQDRIGYQNKPFKLLKLRAYDDIVNENGETETVSTRSGHFLRKFRLNELPQLLNVLRGEMSLVGARPDVLKDFFINTKIIPFYSHRMNISPGITGHAQVCYKYCTDYEEFKCRLEYDLYYIKNKSIKLYILTLLKTVKTVLDGVGE